MSRRRSLSWWYWLFTASALVGSLCGWAGGLAIAVALTALQAVHFGLRARSLSAFPVQVRIAYLGLLLLGAWKPLAPLHAAQLAATLSLLAFDYCPLARMLSLLPWNRRGPLTLARLRATFLSPPVEGSILAALDAIRPGRGGTAGEQRERQQRGRSDGPVAWPATAEHPTAFDSGEGRAALTPAADGN